MLIITGKYGELSNRLFTFANVIAFAVENELSVINPAFEEYACWFRSMQKNILCRYPAKEAIAKSGGKSGHLLYRMFNYLIRLYAKVKLFPSVRLGWQGHFAFEAPENAELIDKMRMAPLSFLDGFYFQDSGNFIKHSEAIREFFRPSPVIEEKVSQFISEERKHGSILVGVHIRQGDYMTHSRGLMYYSTQEYIAVMRKIVSLFIGHSVKLIICSNERQESETFREFTFQFGPGHFIEDLYVLAKCDYIVGAPSTFTQWASFYGRVPKYMINYKNEQFYGVKSKEPELGDFRVHLSGFGKYR
jgi:hypothetical protein